MNRRELLKAAAILPLSQVALHTLSGKAVA